METKNGQKITECKEESKQYLVRVHEEHAALVCLTHLTLDFICQLFNPLLYILFWKLLLVLKKTNLANDAC